MSNYKFETLQLHVGQEKADPVTDATEHIDDIIADLEKGFAAV